VKEVHHGQMTVRQNRERTNYAISHLTAYCLTIKNNITTGDVRDEPGTIDVFGGGFGTAGQNQRSDTECNGA
jgi:hypothetical protein